MKRFLAVALLLFALARPAFADHIGIYRDATAQSCNLDPGYNNTIALVHRFSIGASGVTLRVDFSNAPGSTFLAFNSPFLPAGTSLTTGLSIGYGSCPTGNILVGTITAILNPGTISVMPKSRMAGHHHHRLWRRRGSGHRTAYIGGGGPCDTGVPTEPSTWGSLKALYRD